MTNSSVETSLAFLRGAYRLHGTADVGEFTSLAVNAFPELSKRIRCFGSSWLGYQFATDEARIVSGERQVLLLDPGAGEVLQIPAGVDAFHSSELINQPESAVAFDFYKEWLSLGGEVPGYDQCVGYRVPLFLGGSDTVANLQLTDFRVYWSISADLIEALRGLPIGTRIGRVSIHD